MLPPYFRFYSLVNTGTVGVFSIFSLIVKEHTGASDPHDLVRSMALFIRFVKGNFSLMKQAMAALALPSLAVSGLKVKPNLRRIGTWRDKVSSAKGGEKVIERRPVRNVNRAQLQAPFVSVAVENIVMPNGKVK